MSHSFQGFCNLIVEKLTTGADVHPLKAASCGITISIDKGNLIVAVSDGVFENVFLMVRFSGLLVLSEFLDIVQDWCDTLDQTAFDHLFQDGTEKVLALFKNITNDEGGFRFLNQYLFQLAHDTVIATFGRLNVFCKPCNSSLSVVKGSWQLHKENLLQINSDPAAFTLSYIDWAGSSKTKAGFQLVPEEGGDNFAPQFRCSLRYPHSP